jgi:tetratricopeptide (TPR) repeat protein/DNA-binding XRE family transcriptional regulator
MEGCTVVHETERELLALIIGHRVREARRRKGLSQGELGQGVGSQSMISLIESGRQLPPADVLAILSERLGEPTLAEHVHSVASGEISLEILARSNPSVLLEVLRNHRGRWNEIHGQVALHLCQYYYTNQEFNLVLEVARMTKERLHNNPRFCAEACFFEGSALLATQDYETAERSLLEAELHKSHLDPTLQGRLMFNLGLLYTILDFQGHALWYAKHAVDLFHRNNDFERYGKALGLLGTIQHRMGRMEDARQTLERCFEITDKWGISEVDRGRLEATLANIYYDLGNVEKAELWANRAMQTAEQTSDIHTQCSVLHTMIDIHVRNGTDGSVQALIQKSIRLAELSKHSGLIAQAYLIAAVYLPSEEERLRAAQRAYEVTTNSNLHVDHALAAEQLANCYEAMKYHGEELHYRKIALRSYRNYVAKNSMYKHILHHFPT